jgi:inner membrane protein
MDPLTHAALGATLGRTFFYRQLGTRAVVCGAVMAMTPDLDILSGAAMGSFDRLVAHRGITHSLIFAPVVGTITGWGYWRWLDSRRKAGAPKTVGPPVWIALFILAILSHPLLDLCTTYGTQLLMPFTRDRFALDAIAIVDPVYSGLLVVGLIAASRARERAHSAWYSGVALMLTTAYLLVGMRVNTLAAAEARYQLEMSGVEVVEAYAYPTMLQLPHRRLVVFSPREIRVGFISMWRPCPVQWGVAPVVDNAYTEALRATREGQIYEWFSGDLLAAQVVNDGDRVRVELHDLRYGYEPDPLASMWGIRGYFDPGGQLAGPPERFMDRPEVGWANITRLLSDAFPASCEREPRTSDGERGFSVHQ